MDNSLKRAFAEGLIIGIGANLMADAISGHARDKGYTHEHVFLIGLAAFGLFILISSLDRLQG